MVLDTNQGVVVIAVIMAIVLLWVVTNFRGEQQVTGTIFLLMAIIGAVWFTFKKVL